MTGDSPLEKAFRRAVRLLLVRGRSVPEMRSRLRGMGFDDNVVDETVNRLTEMLYLDDNRFSREWARSCALTKLWGDHKIVMSLGEKGIDRESAEAALSEIRRELSEKEAVEKLVEKRLRARTKSNDEKIEISDTDIRRLISSLKGRGFRTDSIYDVVRRLKEEYLNDRQ